MPASWTGPSRRMVRAWLRVLVPVRHLHDVPLVSYHIPTSPATTGHHSWCPELRNPSRDLHAGTDHPELGPRRAGLGWCLAHDEPEYGSRYFCFLRLDTGGSSAVLLVSRYSDPGGCSRGWRDTKQPSTTCERHSITHLKYYCLLFFSAEPGFTLRAIDTKKQKTGNLVARQEEYCL